MPRTDPVSHLGRFPQGPTPALEREILALGEAAIPALEAAIDGAVTGTREAVARAAGAAGIYARMADERAIPRLVDLVLTAPLDGPLHTAALVAVRSVGSRGRVAEALLAAVVPDEREPYVVELLVRAGVVSEAALQRLVRLIDRQPFLGAQLASYAPHTALLPALRLAFDELPLTGRLDEEVAGTALALAQALDAHGGDAERLGRLSRALEVSIRLHESDVEAIRASVEAIESRVAAATPPEQEPGCRSPTT